MLVFQPGGWKSIAEKVQPARGNRRDPRILFSTLLSYPSLRYHNHPREVFFPRFFPLRSALPRVRATGWRGNRNAE